MRVLVDNQEFTEFLFAITEFLKIYQEHQKICNRRIPCYPSNIRHSKIRHNTSPNGFAKVAIATKRVKLIVGTGIIFRELGINFFQFLAA